jgi:hypothetical protein
MVERGLGTTVEGMNIDHITGERELQAVEEISLYEYASRPCAKKPKPMGSMCPVPSGGNFDVSWPLSASYCKAMILLHQPGCTICPDESISA